MSVLSTHDLGDSDVAAHQHLIGPLRGHLQKDAAGRLHPFTDYMLLQYLSVAKVCRVTCRVGHRYLTYPMPHSPQGDVEKAARRVLKMSTFYHSTGWDCKLMPGLGAEVATFCDTKCPNVFASAGTVDFR